MKQDIIIVSTNDWHGFWFQRQEFATRFAAQGHRVFYINRIPQRIPKPGRIFRWLLAKKQVGKIYNPVPEGVAVLTPFMLPPFRLLRPVNRLLWKRVWSRMKQDDSPSSPILITYQPTYNIIDLASFVGASKICYINTHVYDADPSCPKDLLRAEREIVGKADVLMADSSHNVGRLEAYKPNISVSRAMPGVAVSRFASAFRGDEAEKRNHFLFFGDIGRHLDIDLYNQLAGDHQVTFVGIVDKSIIRDISEKIDVRPPVAPSELPSVLREADILTIFYKPSSYVSGIIPAKFFECLATGKPVFISGLPETNRYKEAIYNIDDGFNKAMEYIQNLPQLETDERRNARAEAARDADWENRFQQFSERIFSS